ncbi:MAG: hypothetical protein EOP83_03945 [Verrucomicrobiaceae bacterium]|nr:MAG: hypothetical protein EOP83_03945 [Verrucomicrobiaceae bacterium]
MATATSKLKVTQLYAGSYEVTDGEMRDAYDFRTDSTKKVPYVVSLTRYAKSRGDGFTGWVAKSEWTSDWYSDPLPTKAEAVEAARYMLSVKHGEDGHEVGDE